MNKITLVTQAPTIEIIAEKKLVHKGVMRMADWVERHRPDCVPAEGFGTIFDLLPHDGRESLGIGQDTFRTEYERIVSDNELLVEIAGRKCYDSFAEKAGKKTNREYIANTQQGHVPHRSIKYHAGWTFFIGDISMRVARELQRNYIGHAKDEEGAPSQESTRFVHHYGWFVVPPAILAMPEGLREPELETFRVQMQGSYDQYLNYVSRHTLNHEVVHGKKPTGLDRKRIYEAAANLLPMSACTSFIWSSNPEALDKLFVERCDESADLEFARFAKEWRTITRYAAPNLFRAQYPDEKVFDQAQGKIE
jgi:thymidylate synthase ThyX